MSDPAASSDVDRFRRVASGVRKKLVGMALEHVKKHDDVKNELLTHAATSEGADSEAPLDHNGKAVSHPGDMHGDQPEHKMSDLPSQAEQAKEHEQERDDRRSEEQSSDMASLGAAAKAKPSGAEDHGLVEKESDGDHSAEPAQDPDTGWTQGSRKLGKTARGIIGAYKGSK